MKSTDITTQKLWEIAESVCNGAGYELVDLSLTQSRSGWVLRVFIDHLPNPASTSSQGVPEQSPNEANEELDDGSSISFDDCERVSRELGVVLDVEDPITHAYSLEVSSPGLDRPLRTPAHFERYVEHVVRITLHQGIAGRRNFKGTLIGLETPEGSSDPEQRIVKINVDGTEYQLPFSDIDSARLVPNWDSLFQKGQQS